MPTLMNIGVDPDIRIDQRLDEVRMRDADMMRNALLERGYDLQDMPQEMTGRRTDNYSRRLRKLWRKPLEYKRRIRREILNDDWENVEMPQMFGYSVPKNVVNKKLYLSIRNKLKKSIKGRRWGAYDSGRLVKMYKKRGGKYSGKKGKTNLGRWYKEKWVDACAWPKRKPCGRQTKSKIAYCRPSKRVDSKTPKLIQSLSRSTIKSRCARKRKNPKKRINPRKSRFGSWSRDFFEALMNVQPDCGGDLTEPCRRITKEQLILRCKEHPFYNKYKCDRILLNLLVNIYKSVVHRIPRKKIHAVRKTFLPVLKKFETEIFEEEIIDYAKLRIILGLLQDEFLEWTKDVAILASALLYGIQDID
jgi:hypothetical protein